MTIGLDLSSDLSRQYESGASADSLEPFFRPYSVWKLVVLGSLSANLHLLYWFWSQWRADAPNDGRGWTAFKTAFSLIFAYSMARDVRDEAVRRGVPCRYAPVAVAGGLWATAIALRVLPDTWVLSLVWLMPSVLTPIQSTINRLHRETSRKAPASWRWWEIGLVILLGLYWLLVVIGLLLPPPPLE